MARLIRIALVLMVAGCSSDGSPKGGADGSDDPGALDSAGPGDSGDTGDDTGAEPLPLLNGEFLVGFKVGPVAGLVVSLQVEIAMSVDEEGQRTMDAFILRASDGIDAVSDDLTMVSGVPVAADGSFSVDLPLFTLPAEFSPTSNPVDIDSVMTGTVQSGAFFCGDVTGTIVSFDMDLAGSTFGGIPWADRILGAPAGCEDVEIEEVPRISDCPSMATGRSTDFVSGGIERELELIVPDDHTTLETWPLLLALHGIGSDIDAIVDGSDLREKAAALGVIVVAPQAMDRGGTAAWDPVGPPAVNLDIVLADDLIKCVSEQYSVDPDRIYVSGMSLGGIMTGTLIATRSEVFAAAMPFSGGFMTALGPDTLPIPTLVSWGGVEDTHYGQDFNYLAGEMLADLTEAGHGVVSCNHDTGHNLDPEHWDYALTFLMDHNRSSRALAYEDSLPASFPAYCGIVSADDR